jgi:hypothetical protein
MSLVGGQNAFYFWIIVGGLLTIGGAYVVDKMSPAGAKTLSELGRGCPGSGRFDLARTRSLEKDFRLTR